MLIREHVDLWVRNPILDDPQKPITEAMISDIRVTDVRAVYPVMCAINANRLTKNYTLYSKECLVGRKDIEKPTGYSSFVMPTGKPVISEHRLMDSPGFLGPGTEADVPMGRIIYAAYKAAKKGDPQTPPKNKLHPGCVEGSGWMMLVPAITEPEAVNRVLGGQYHTISIGSEMGKIVESISGIDLVKARREGLEMPTFSKGQVYKVEGEDRLSYWDMFDLMGMEASYVNNPSDVRAFNKEKDLGEDGIRLLLGEKKPGSPEFSFYDAKTLEKVENFLPEEEFATDPTFTLTDSVASPVFYRVDAERRNVIESGASASLELLSEERLNAFADKLYGLLAARLENSPAPAVLTTPEADVEPMVGTQEGQDPEPTEGAPIDNTPESNLTPEERLLKILQGEEENES